MNSLGNEVTVKVKEAIRSKLKEMKANSSNEIIDYIMLLVTTKKSTAELAKSIDFLMENNTSVFVKWLSAIIKNLQQVTVSTAVKDISDNFEVSKNITTDIKRHYNKTEIDDVKFCGSEEKKEFLIESSVSEKNIQAINGKKEKCLPEKIITKGDVNKIVSKTEKLIKIKEEISFSSIESGKINSIKNDSKVISTAYKQNTNTCEEDVDCKKKRPRISINSDDEDEKIIKRPIITTKEPFKPIKKDFPKQNVNKSMSKVVVIPPKAKNDIDKTQKKLFMHDLVVQRIDHQRGALALDTAFKYIQQQIGASDTDILVVKKWRDYAVEMLRSSKVPKS